MSTKRSDTQMMNKSFQSDCENCFGLCCVALPYAKSADFAFSKDGGEPCKNLQADFRCKIHTDLRGKGFKGCTVYECFGAGQKVSQITYQGKNWRDNPNLANQMFDVFPRMQQIHEMLYYLDEVLRMGKESSIHETLLQVYEETELLTDLCPEEILSIDIPCHRAKVSILLTQVSEQVRAKTRRGKQQLKIEKGATSGSLIGASLQGAQLKGSNLRGALLIAADLRNADIRDSDFLGADLRDANICGANLLGSIFLTQAQVNAAKGNQQTKLPEHLQVPEHWLNED
ncbi:pentapeptide repeat-containing protein [Metabacillus malikii]|uniref:Uncharacterized protein YjbI with pentapeptide repeats n=1 Tax=Metabacillus malikii TaxID=1504265 RepID=A0ABT9ZJ29_9BACI|nr:pentapeptide repeat-containing protein [Metabacillus malikii]MDQ0231816.1 uncharacterized protein YjbI with pentapeptide repeats [Metabacillus malikii]